MKPSYRRDGEHTYLVLESPRTVTGSEYSVRMLLENRIPGLLECKLRMLDGHPLFYYEITSKQTVVRAFEGEKLGKEDMRRLLTGIRRGMEEAENYLLNINDLLLLPEYIYLDPERREVFLCLLPFSEELAAERFTDLAEYILKHLDHSDREAVLWGYEIYSLSERENYSLKEVLQSIYLNRREDRQEPDDEMYKEKTSFPTWPEEGEKDRKSEPSAEEEKQLGWTVGPSANNTKKSCFFMSLAGVGAACVIGAALRVSGLGWTQIGGILCFVLGFFGFILKRLLDREDREGRGDLPHSRKAWLRVPGSGAGQALAWREEQEEKDCFEEEDSVGETRVLCAEPAFLSEAALIGIGGNERRFVLTKKHLVVGKLKERADFILEGAEVSRVHAKIERERDGYYLTDLNSRNGTYVNGIRLEADEARKLEDQDQIRFGNASFFFRQRLAQEMEIHYNETIT